MIDPNFAKNGTSPIIICNAQGENISVSADKLLGHIDKKPIKQNGDNSEHCNNVSIAHSININNPIEFHIAENLQKNEIKLPNPIVSIGHGLAAPPPPKTGPPIQI